MLKYYIILLITLTIASNYKEIQTAFSSINSSINK